MSSQRKFFSIDIASIRQEADLHLAQFFKSLGAVGDSNVLEKKAAQHALFNQMLVHAYIAGTIQATIYGACSEQSEKDFENISRLLSEGLELGYAIQMSYIQSQGGVDEEE